MSWLREANSEPIPGYRLIEPLGSGGFGEVWKCEVPGGLCKAIKFVYGNVNSLDEDNVRADQEFKALQQIKEVRHPFVCSVERIDFVDGELVIVMELAERTLNDLYQECQASGLIGIPGDDLLRYMRDAAEALDFMNEKHNLQHLDVKPRNLFLVGDRVKVADFGLVKHLERSSASGLLGGVTPLYAPPETYLGKISPHSDQYSLGIVYQEMLTGHRPFQAKNVRQMAQLHLQGEPDLRSLPEVERPILARVLSKDPAKRFANCMAFVAALYKARSSVRAEPARTGSSSQRPKSMADTMEDIFLEGYESQPPVPSGLHEDEAVAKMDVTSASVEVSNLGVTVMQPDHGALRPALIIGVGAFGRKAITELRCRFLDRFGDLSKLPVVRFLCLDIDPEAGSEAVRSAPDLSLGRGEFFPLPLQPVGNYRRRSLDHLSEWLPREKLYSMPRSLKAEGSRALGRLSFADNQQRLLARLKREIQEITSPENIFQAVEKTGLALGNSTPRIYVMAAAGGGSSGMLTDLGYAIRRLLATLRHADAPVAAFLLGGAPLDPATPRAELANLYATLTELNHFSDPLNCFHAQYGADGQRLSDQGPPYHSVYLLPLTQRGPADVKMAVAHLGSYLFHEISTPLGRRLEELRLANLVGDAGVLPGSLSLPLHSFGTYSVWFPRGLLLQYAARQASVRLLDSWTTTEAFALREEATEAIKQLVDRYAHGNELSNEALAAEIDRAAQSSNADNNNASPGAMLASVLARLEEQLSSSLAQDDPASWTKQALTRVREWVGGSGAGDEDLGEWRKTRLSRLLSMAGQKIAEQWEQRIIGEAFTLMQFPGARLAAAEMALDRLRQGFVAAGETQAAAGQQQQAAKAAQAWRQLEAAQHECVSGGGFRLFGGRSRTRQLRTFMDALAHYAQVRLADELAAACRACLMNLSSRLGERGRDLGFCRQRLRALRELLQYGPADPDEGLTNTRPAADHTLSASPLPAPPEAYWETIRDSATARVVLPEGQTDLEKAALHFMQDVDPSHWIQLDRELYEHILQPQGGLHGACSTGDLTRQLAAPLLEACGKYLGQLLPVMDVAQLIKSETESSSTGTLKDQIQEYLDRAAPMLAGKAIKQQAQILLLPATPVGKALGESLLAIFPELRLVRVPGQSDLMFLREQTKITAADLEPLLHTAREAYVEALGARNTSPHSRFDIDEWLPLDP